jgi:hypothetical protein
MHAAFRQAIVDQYGRVVWDSRKARIQDFIRADWLDLPIDDQPISLDHGEDQEIDLSLQYSRRGVFGFVIRTYTGEFWMVSERLIAQDPMVSTADLTRELVELRRDPDTAPIAETLFATRHGRPMFDEIMTWCRGDLGHVEDLTRAALWTPPEKKSSSASKPKSRKDPDARPTRSVTYTQTAIHPLALTLVSTSRFGATAYTTESPDAMEARVLSMATCALTYDIRVTTLLLTALTAA